MILSDNIKKHISIKRLDWLLIKSFIGPYILTFFIALFVLVMQFLWKYIDDLVGKGLSTPVLLELLFYASLRFVPLAMPLAVLLSSIMTFGSLGEHFELTAMKSAGVSLLRIMQPLAITATFISIFAFFFSNNLLPVANLKFQTLLYDIRNQKPSVAIKEGIFYNEIDGFNIRVEKKDEDGNTLRDIILYDHSSGQGTDHVIYAKKGTLIQDEKNMTLTFFLENGRQYKDVSTRKKPEDAENYDMYYTTFDSWEKKFDLSKFKLTRSDEGFFKDMKQMMTVMQLKHQLDSSKREEISLVKSLRDYTKPYIEFTKFEKDTTRKNLEKLPLFRPFKKIDEAIKVLPKEERKVIFDRALTQARNMKNYTDIVKNQLDYKRKEIVQHLIEIYRKFTLSIACLLMFFIGAPLGSIIRKGGLGWPLALSIVFFILYYVINIFGEKSAEKMVMSAFSGMWLSSFVLLPIGAFLTFQAMNDSKLFSREAYIKIIKLIIPRWSEGLK
ncbi:MAG TPA: LptF/LptG family permease [Chitinophagales bacterium]